MKQKEYLEKVRKMRNYLPSDVYALLIETRKHKPSELNISDEDWHKARCYMLNLQPNGCAISWNISYVRDFTPEEKHAVRECVVRDYGNGLSMRFRLWDGNHATIPLMNNMKTHDGAEFNIDDLQVVSLVRNSWDQEIYRICFKGTCTPEDVESEITASKIQNWLEFKRELWNTRLNPLRHAQWDYQGKHQKAKVFWDCIPY